VSVTAHNVIFYLNGQDPDDEKQREKIVKCTKAWEDSTKCFEQILQSKQFKGRCDNSVDKIVAFQKFLSEKLVTCRTELVTKTREIVTRTFEMNAMLLEDKGLREFANPTQVNQ